MKRWISMVTAAAVLTFGVWPCAASEEAAAREDEDLLVILGDYNLSETSSDTYFDEEADEQARAIYESIPFTEEFLAQYEAKNKLVEEYYAAFMAGNGELADQKLMEIEQLGAAQLAEEKLAAQQAAGSAAQTGDQEAVQQSADAGTQLGENAAAAALPQPTITLYSASACYSNSVNMTQFPQETGYYCGPSAAKSILYSRGVYCAQSTLALSTYLNTDNKGATDWYIGGSSAADKSNMNNYPMVRTLRKLLPRNYSVYPASGSATASQVSAQIVATVNAGYGVAVNGNSKRSASDASHLENYPTNKDIGHWLAVEGYSDYGDTIKIVDPAANSPALLWGGDIQPHYEITSSKLQAFRSWKGIIC